MNYLALDALRSLISTGLQTSQMQSIFTVTSCADLLEHTTELLDPWVELATHSHISPLSSKLPIHMVGPEDTLLRSVIHHISCLSATMMDLIGRCSDGASKDWVAERRDMSPSPSPMGRPHHSTPRIGDRHSGWGAPEPLEMDVCLVILKTAGKWIHNLQFLGSLKGIDNSVGGPCRGDHRWADIALVEDLIFKELLTLFRCQCRFMNETQTVKTPNCRITATFVRFKLERHAFSVWHCLTSVFLPLVPTGLPSGDCCIMKSFNRSSASRDCGAQAV